MDTQSQMNGVLYVVATPIGNLADMGKRALEVLASVERIAAEDTRHSRKLLQHFSIQKSLLALHEHNEREITPKLIGFLEAGETIALISDAGTPLISDPGFNLVRAARKAGIRVVPIPGPCAMICALSASGLPTDRFVFEGFLPPRSAARRARLEELENEPRTLVFYESGHRIVECLHDFADIFGAGRCAVLARELTKQFETIQDGTLGFLSDWVRNERNQQKGEMVLLVHGRSIERTASVTPEAEKTLRILLQEDLPVKQAAKLAAHLTGVNKRALYERALELKGK